ncbi:MAG: TIGR04086 family membrane protein [Bacillota bacterium]|nr:MAG: TIGR04086 family membrane protein [Bacillota bacterium]
MRRADGGEAPVDWGALASGVLWGLLLMAVSSLALGLLDFRFPPNPREEAARALIVQGVAALLAGGRAAWRSGRGRMVHGLAAGVGLMAAVTVIIGIFRDLPGAVGLVRALLLGAGAGALAGAAAAGFSRR